jgi:hypothetical protein
MKINIIKVFTAVIVAGAIAIPAFALAEAPNVEGQNSGAGTASPSPVPVVVAQNSGAGTTGNVPPVVSGQNGGAGTAGSVPPVVSGQNSGAGTGGTVPPVVSGQNSGAGTSGDVPPVVSGQNSGAGTVNIVPPVVTGQNSGAGTTGTVPPVVSGQNSGAGTTGTVTNPSNPGTTNPPAGGGTNNPGGFVQSGGGSSVSSGTSGGSLPLLTNIGDCNYLTVYLKLGAANPIVEVTKLQNFLKNNEGMNITVTGTFDQATFNAVSAFQAKYKVDVLSPWGIGHTTGFVYYTTTKKINELFCKKNFALTSAQLKEIEAYRTGIKNTATISNEVGAGTTTPAIANATSTNSNQVAGAAKASVGSKIWKFIKTIFGR